MKSNITIQLNGQAIECAEGTSLAALLVQVGRDPSSCATAVNGGFVARTQRGEATLHHGDQIMTFEPITGG